MTEQEWLVHTEPRRMLARGSTPQQEDDGINEAAWSACDDHIEMLDSLRSCGRATDRKLSMARKVPTLADLLRPSQ